MFSWNSNDKKFNNNRGKSTDKVDDPTLTPAERRKLKRKQKRQADLDFIDWAEGIDAILDDDY